MDEILSKVILSMLGVIGTALGTLIVWLVKQYLLPWLKTKLSDTQYNFIRTCVRDLMTAAEELYKGQSHAGQSKTEWVVKQIMSRFPKLEYAYVESLIKGLMGELEKEGLVNKDK